MNLISVGFETLCVIMCKFCLYILWDGLYFAEFSILIQPTESTNAQGFQVSRITYRSNNSMHVTDFVLKLNAWEKQKTEHYLPPEWGGGPQSRTTPWPSRTDTVLLILVLKFSRSDLQTKQNKTKLNFKK